MVKRCIPSCYASGIYNEERPRDDVGDLHDGGVG